MIKPSLNAETLKENERIKAQYRKLQLKNDELVIETESLKLQTEMYDDIILPTPKRADDPLIIKNTYDKDYTQYRGCLWRLGGLFKRNM